MLSTASHQDGHGGYLTLCKIDKKTGLIEKEHLLNLADVDKLTLKQFGLSRFVKLSDTSFSFEAYTGGKQDVMVKIQLD